MFYGRTLNRGDEVDGTPEGVPGALGQDNAQGLQKAARPLARTNSQIAASPVRAVARCPLPLPFTSAFPRSPGQDGRTVAQ